ncbi:hypothetical protein HUT19_31850 [Streptomyces sp. NA02950]|uniref:hypothetical protein n=1 Tax=Streptomyces sp. NA02950 TaxID=2742137 RepID=UPI00159087BE|nr:hypothetical protein [Streptomyces sp. NA02950]QKV95773.1 hypothetical protein HUT19_31850 [Streptomyces sp. NA02950]
MRAASTCLAAVTPAGPLAALVPLPRRTPLWWAAAGSTAVTAVVLALSGPLLLIPPALATAAFCFQTFQGSPGPRGSTGFRGVQGVPGLRRLRTVRRHRAPATPTDSATATATGPRLTSPGGVAAVVCMGDTPTHLPAKEDVPALLTDVARALARGGRLVITYRI